MDAKKPPEPQPIWDDETMDQKIKLTKHSRRWLHKDFDKNDSDWGW